MIQTAKNDPPANARGPGKNRSPALKVDSLPLLFLLTYWSKAQEYRLSIKSEQKLT